MKAQITIVLFAALTALCCSVVFPGKGYKEIHYKNLSPIVTEDYSLSFTEMHSQKDFVVMRMKVQNLSANYLCFERSKVIYTVEGTSQNLTPKRYLIKPLGKRSFTLRTAPMEGLPAEQASVELGGVGVIPIKGTLPDLESYPLPDTKKMISTDNLQIKLSRMLKKTKVTECTFEILNIGKEPVLYDPSRITATAEGNDAQWPTPEESNGYKVLWPGKDVDFHVSFSIPGKIVDMQFANMLVHWNETFLISTVLEAEATELKLEMDLGKTEGNN